jgi:hypothetical protein
MRFLGPREEAPGPADATKVGTAAGRSRLAGASARRSQLSPRGTTNATSSALRGRRSRQRVTGAASVARAPVGILARRRARVSASPPPASARARSWRPGLWPTRSTERAVSGSCCEGESPRRRRKGRPPLDSGRPGAPLRPSRASAASAGTTSRGRVQDGFPRYSGARRSWRRRGGAKAAARDRRGWGRPSSTWRGEGGREPSRAVPRWRVIRGQERHRARMLTWSSPSCDATPRSRRSPRAAARGSSRGG